jgi:hypothetical protein
MKPKPSCPSGDDQVPHKHGLIAQDGRCAAAAAHGRFLILLVLAVSKMLLHADHPLGYLYDTGDPLHRELARRISAPATNDPATLESCVDRFRHLVLSDRVAFYVDLQPVNEAGHLTLRGSTERIEFKNLACGVFSELGYGPVGDEIQLVPDPATDPNPFGLTVVPHVATWALPDLTGAPMDEALYGEPVYLLKELPEAWLIKTATGYWGYADKAAIQRVARKVFIERLNGPKVTVLQDQSVDGRLVPGGCSLVLREWGSGDRCTVAAPDGRALPLPKSACRRSDRDAAMKDLIAFARTFLHSPYRLGGRNRTAGIDCSGFIQQCFRTVGMNLARDAKQQYLSGHLLLPCVTEALLPGDALFFMNEAGQVYHVALYAGDEQIIHAIGQEVQVHSINPKATNYFERMDGQFIGAKRFFE